MQDEPDHDPSDDGMLLSRIVISRYLEDNGDDRISVDRGDLTRLEVLGLLHFAALSVWNSDQEGD